MLRISDISLVDVWEDRRKTCTDCTHDEGFA